MRTLLFRFVVMAGILAQACGQDTVRYNNTTKAVISPVPFRVGQSAIDPTAPGNGSIWYDTANNTLEARVNGATVNLVSGSITGADTRVLFFDGANTPAGDPGFLYNKTTNTATLGVPSVTDGNLVLRRAANAFTTTLKTGVTGASYTLTLPTTDGAADEFLQTNGSGALTWATVSSGLTIGTTPITSGVAGRLLYETAGNVLGEVAAGLTTEILVGGGAGAIPVWTVATGTGAPVRATGPSIANANLTGDTLFTNLVGGTITGDGSTLTNLSAGSILTDTLATARGGTGVSNAGTITNASNTTITGGGTIALGGFTLTVPSTGTAVTTATLNNNTLPMSATALVTSGAVTAVSGNVTGLNLVVNGTGGGVYFTVGDTPLTGLLRPAANTIQMGPTAATGTNQKFGSMNATAGTGGNMTLYAGGGTTAGGAVLFQTAVTTTLVDVGKFDASSTAGHTRFFLYDVDNSTLERVTVGVADSGGAGFKVLRIPN